MLAQEQMRSFSGRRIWTKIEGDPYLRLAAAIMRRAIKDLRHRAPSPPGYWKRDRRESIAFFRRQGDIFDSICAVVDVDSEDARRGIEQRTGMTFEEWEEESR